MRKPSVKKMSSLPAAKPQPVKPKPLKVAETDSCAIVGAILRETVLKNLDYAIWISDNDRFIKPLQAK